ncbi:hypothetical protein [Streptomyces sp. NPDC002078]
MSHHFLPLCAVCAAAQLHGRWREARWEREGWKIASEGIGKFAVLVAVVGTLAGAPLGHMNAGLWLGAGIGIAAAYVAFERWYYERKAPR